MEKEKSWKTYLVDTAAMISVSLPGGLFNEVLISGMTLEQSLHARFMAIWADILTARLYGIYRDYIFRRCNTTDASTFIRKGLTDIFSYITFQVPVYAGILAAAGAELHQILIASSMAALFSAVSGRPYGIFLDWFRRLFGLRAATEHSKEIKEPITLHESEDN
jgi:hypothetical protein